MSARAPYRVTFAILLLGLAVAPLESQDIGDTGASRYRLEIGAAASTPIVEDGNGVAVRRGIGPFAMAEVSWTIDDRAALAVSLRGSVAPLRLRSSERRWSGGWARQLDLAVRLERALSASTAVGAGLGAALLHGPGDIVPFRGSRGIVYGWGPEVSIVRRISQARRLDAVLAGDAIRIHPPDQDTAVVGGWIGRLRLGVRHAL